MMAIKPIGSSTTVGTLLYDISNQLPDNNAGQISAKDVRETMFNLTESIPYVIASGDWDVANKEFISDIRLRRNTVDSITSGGTLIVQSGIVFEDNGNPDGTALQTRPYLGPTGISHSELKDLTGTSNDHHTQYLLGAGTRSMSGDLGMGSNFIKFNNEATADIGHGINFEFVDANEEVLHIGSKTHIEFDVDTSTIKTGRSTAQAWVNFNSVSGVAEADTLDVRSSYNISSVRRVTEGGEPQAGKFRIYFATNTFDSAADICAIGTSNAKSSNASGGEIDSNTAVCVERTAEYVTFYVMDDTNAFRDAEVNDVMIFGNPSGVPTPAGPTVSYVPA
jgi:hypothetical protein